MSQPDCEWIPVRTEPSGFQHPAREPAYARLAGCAGAGGTSFAESGQRSPDLPAPCADDAPRSFAHLPSQERLGPPAPPTGLFCRTDTRTAGAGKTLSTAYQPRISAFKTREPHGQQQNEYGFRISALCRWMSEFADSPQPTDRPPPDDMHAGAAAFNSAGGRRPARRRCRRRVRWRGCRPAARVP